MTDYDQRASMDGRTDVLLRLRGGCALSCPSRLNKEESDARIRESLNRQGHGPSANRGRPA